MQEQTAVIYNVTTKVAHSIADKWLQWMKEEYISRMLETGCFTKATILRMIEVDESEGLTYAVQYASPGKEEYNLYIERHAERMSRVALSKWGANIISFRSVLEVVD
ncbi:MAG: DUF4286 domain-containing protein [Citrobacter freundii]|nr:MAG: DUF4286 domain-containing protein [Citrobacter freundii]